METGVVCVCTIATFRTKILIWKPIQLYCLLPTSAWSYHRPEFFSSLIVVAYRNIFAIKSQDSRKRCNKNCWFDTFVGLLSGNRAVSVELPIHRNYPPIIDRTSARARGSKLHEFFAQQKILHRGMRDNYQ